MIAAARRAGSADAGVLDQLDRLGCDHARATPAEPLIFMAWLRETVRAIYRDDLGRGLRALLRHARRWP